MISKDQLAAAMLHECDVALHLHSKLPPAALGYRPSPAQRTTLDLLRYLSICGIAGITCMATGDWKRFGEFTDRSKDMPADGFPALMEQQKREITAFFARTTEEQLESQETGLPGGGTLPLGAAILNGPLKWLTGYKLQLFLYAKANGVTDIGTANAWGGRDRAAS